MPESNKPIPSDVDEWCNDCNCSYLPHYLLVPTWLEGVCILSNAMLPWDCRSSSSQNTIKVVGTPVFAVFFLL